jgi:hypothetical protein
MTPAPKITPANMPKDNPNDTDKPREEENLTDTDRAPETDDKPEKREAITRVGRNGIVNTEMPSHAANDDSNVVFRDSAGQEHGPMPLSEWADYSRKNNL